MFFFNNLEGFEEFNFNEGVPYVSITNNGITFNKSVVMKMDYPPFVKLLINRATKQIAVIACDEGAPNATAFYKQRKKNVISVRWNGRDLLNTIQEITEWDLSIESYKIEGQFLREENAMLFNLTEAQPLT